MLSAIFFSIFRMVFMQRGKKKGNKWKKSKSEVAESTFCFQFSSRCICTNLALRKLGLWKKLWPVSEMNKEPFLPVLETSYEISGISLAIGVTVCPRAGVAISFLPPSFLIIANSSGEVPTCMEWWVNALLLSLGIQLLQKIQRTKKLWVFIWNHRWPVAVSKWILIYASCLCSCMGFYFFFGIV